MTGKQEANGKRDYNKKLRISCSVLNITGLIKSRNIKRNTKIGGTYSEHTFSTESNEAEVDYISALSWRDRRKI